MRPRASNGVKSFTRQVPALPGTRDAAPGRRSAHLLDALLPCHGLARALAGPGVGAGPLAADREALAMTEPAIAADVAEPGDVLLDLPAELPFHRVFVIQEPGELGQV